MDTILLFFIRPPSVSSSARATRTSCHCASECDVCTSGRYSDARGTMECSFCALGTFRGTADVPTTCVSCPAGTVTLVASVLAFGATTELVAANTGCKEFEHIELGGHGIFQWMGDAWTVQEYASECDRRYHDLHNYFLYKSGGLYPTGRTSPSCACLGSARMPVVCTPVPNNENNQNDGKLTHTLGHLW